ncbi:MAG: formamidopyrimidine-DNA glycosylase [Phycisphaerae bacterium]|nr:formamidopyrimidine-DNA glycosylase [Phycisphaerae bacterium]
MPELPDIEAYLAAIGRRIVGQTLKRARIAQPFFLRTAEPPIEAVCDREVARVCRIGKRVVISLNGDHHLVIHLMIAGRFRWGGAGSVLIPRVGLAAFDFPTGTLHVTEAGSKHRASLYVVVGEAALRQHDPGGIEPMSATLDQFMAAVRREHHTLKRTLTDPRIFAGIGNAYSDEIIHAARLSPLRLTGAMSDDEIIRLFNATRDTLAHWTNALTASFIAKFPGAGDVTAFRDGFAVHGRFNQPCRVCETAIQRIRYADNETNYCPACQTQGRILADRSLSRLLRKDWPRTVEELERGGERSGA